MAQDILIVVNCKLSGASAIQMYCDPSILDRSPEGSYELGVRVPLGTVLRWRAVPLQLAEGTDGDAGVYHVIIKQYHLWDNAGQYLTEWGTSNGGGDAPLYLSPGNLAADTPAALSTEGIDRPFIECLTQLTNRDESVSPRVAYSFTVSVYKNGDQVNEFTWDPYVTIYRP